MKTVRALIYLIIYMVYKIKKNTKSLFNKLPKNVIPINVPFQLFKNNKLDNNDEIILKLCYREEDITINVPKENNFFELNKDFPIGKYNLIIQNKQIMDIYVVFNPYSFENLDDENLDDKFLKEYVFDTKVMHYCCKNKKWHLNQFDPLIYETMAFYINKLDETQRSDPVYICRYMIDKCNCAQINKNNKSNDESNDLLCGRWNGDYSDGIEPSSWISSIDIIKNFNKTKEPVKYGQCWVFAYLLMTLLRNICIPTRFIYNEDSAHIKTTQSVYKNKLFMNGDKKNGSIWNFHCWNECYLIRNDLKTDNDDNKYDGWQVIDATPQELSVENNKVPDFICGPCSVTAIKEYNKILRDSLNKELKDLKSLKKTINNFYNKKNVLLSDDIKKFNTDNHYDREFIAGETFYVKISKSEQKSEKSNKAKFKVALNYSNPSVIGTSKITELNDHYF
jgi:hypothetical protein